MLNSKTNDKLSLNKTASWHKKLTRLWDARIQYAEASDWFRSLYQRVLLHFPRLPLPRRNRLRQVRIVGMSEPFHVRLGTTDWYVLEEIFLDRIYEPLTKRQLRDIRNIVDLGANAGFTIRLWQLMYPAARIVAVEPDAQNLEMCRRNALGDMMGSRLHLVQACVAARARTVFLDRSGGAWGFSMRDAGSAAEDYVQALTLPQILESCGIAAPIDLLKCDIEGTEAELFANCSAWIGNIRNLIVELHHPYSSEHFLADLQRGGGRFDTYFQMRCDGNSELLFLEQAQPRSELSSPFARPRKT